jgi:signal transduction histidine kinase
VIALLAPDGRGDPLQRFNGDLASLNLTVIEMPAQSGTIARAVMRALRARERQYQLRDFIAALVEAEETLRTQNRESAGVPAGGVLGNVSIALDSLRPGERAQEFPGHVLGASERAAHLTRQLPAYAGKALFILKPLELNTLIRDMYDLIRASLGQGVEIRFDLSDNLPSMLGDSSQVEQIVMNLIVHGAEAIPRGERGTVTVATRLEHLDEAYIRSILSLDDPVQPGSYVCLEVSDTGTGMTPEILKRIFDPFFSTKCSGRGLGLAAVTGIVRGHQGLLRVWSEPGNGSVFRILFPVVPAGNCAVKKHGDSREDLSGLYF